MLNRDKRIHPREVYPAAADGHRDLTLFLSLSASLIGGRQSFHEASASLPPCFETGETVNLCSRVSTGASVLPDPLVPCRVNFYEFRAPPLPRANSCKLAADTLREIQLAAANRPN